MEKTIKVPPRNNNKETPRVYPITKGPIPKGPGNGRVPYTTGSRFFGVSFSHSWPATVAPPKKTHSSLTTQPRFGVGLRPSASGTWSQSASTPVLLRCEMR